MRFVSKADNHHRITQTVRHYPPTPLTRRFQNSSWEAPLFSAQLLLSSHSLALRRVLNGQPQPLLKIIAITPPFSSRKSRIMLEASVASPSVEQLLVWNGTVMVFGALTCSKMTIVPITPCTYRRERMDASEVVLRVGEALRYRFLMLVLLVRNMCKEFWAVGSPKMGSSLVTFIWWE